ncbi:MAG: hypothetical protein JW797_00555 [Bradymonadales bacterium]|nr:hypothetical protein [Bradymonadales bacterium]
MRHLLIGLVLVGITLAIQPQTASAQQAQYDCTDVESCARLGTELFQSDQFLPAALVLEYAYQLDPVNVLLYNIARAYQRGNRCVRSSSYFRRYLDSGDTQAREQAAQHEPGQTACAERYHGLILQAEAALSASQPDQALALLTDAREFSDEPEARLMMLDLLLDSGTPENCQLASDTLGQVSALGDYSQTQWETLQELQQRTDQCLGQITSQTDQQQCLADRDRLDADWRHSVKTRQLIGIITAGVGGAVLIGAVVHDIVSQGTIDDYEAAAAAGDAAQYNSLRDDLSSAKTVSIILYAAGAATTAAGLVVWLTAGGTSPAESIDCSSVSWDFGFGLPSGEAGLWFSGVF